MTPDTPRYVTSENTTSNEATGRPPKYNRGEWRPWYLQGWRDAMTEVKGGDWSDEFPVWWPDPPAPPELDQPTDSGEAS